MSRRNQNQRAHGKRLPPIREEGASKTTLSSIQKPRVTAAWSQGPPKNVPVTQRQHPAAVPSPVSVSTLAPAVYAEPWPETDDYGTPPASTTYVPPTPPSKEELLVSGDKIVRAIDREVKWCLSLSCDVPQTYIRLTPSPTYSPFIDSYVSKKVKELALAKDVIWDRQDTFTIVF